MEKLSLPQNLIICEGLGRRKKGQRNAVRLHRRPAVEAAGRRGTPALSTVMAGAPASGGVKNQPHSQLCGVTTEIHIPQLLQRKESVLSLEFPSFKKKLLKLMHWEYSRYLNLGPNLRD